MLSSIELLAIVTIGVLALGAVEVVRHRWNLEKIPIRIHVSGTRGKSSVTRLIAAGLREAGITTAAKTTGTLARMILPDANEIPVFRPSGANIIEQIRIIATARDFDAKAIVVECMALQPEYHWLSESLLVRATHGVITNIRADHLDVMGPTEEDVAKAIASMTPVKGVLFTAERRHLHTLQMAANDRGTLLIAVTDDDLKAVTDDDLAKFSYTEHRENVALVLKILEHLGVARDVALRGLWKTKPDPGALTEHTLDFFGRRIIFVNGFAANDPESSEMIWRLSRKRYQEVEQTIALFNLRADRPSRTVQLAKDASFWREADKVVLMGTGAYLFARVAAEDGEDASRFAFGEDESIEEIFERIVELCTSGSTLIVGMGNIGGQGLGLVRYFRNRSLPGNAR
ncbi:MAG: poly-gamma-glutamate synthase PgsB [Myxococcota bacterium]